MDAYYNIGYVNLVYKDRYREAIDWFDKALELAPDYHQAYHNRGLCYENLGKRDSAIRNYREALRIQEGNFKPSARGLQRLDAEYRSP